jgi:hypothetical protein
MLPLGTPERAADGSAHVWLDPGVVAKLKALRGLGEGCDDAIVRLAKSDGREAKG